MLYIHENTWKRAEKTCKLIAELNKEDLHATENVDNFIVVISSSQAYGCLSRLSNDNSRFLVTDGARNNTSRCGAQMHLT